MARAKLSSRKVDTLPPGKYGDGDGLWLLVSKNGQRRWTFRYSRNRRAHEMGLGHATGKNLAKARKEASRWRSVLRDGLDPLDVKREEEAAVQLPVAVPVDNTFAKVAEDLIAVKRQEFKNAKHAAQWEYSLLTLAAPLGPKSVNQITQEDILAVVEPIWQTTNETARRTLQRIAKVIDAANAGGLRDGPNPAAWHGGLEFKLPKPSKVRKVQHFPALPYAELPVFMSELRQDTCTASLALQFTILTAARSGEILGATWGEIGDDVWIIPAERMKAGREHRVPLSSAALAVLETVPRLKGNPFVFAGHRYGRPLSGMSMLMLLRRMGRDDLTVHGFRSSFRDWLEEQTDFQHRVCEAALAHTVRDKTVAAYQRGTLFAKRQALMQAWANFCTSRGHVLEMKKR